MPELAGRRVFYAALAVPIAMVIAPLTASAGEADETVVTEQAQPGAVATENETAPAANATDVAVFSYGPGWSVLDDVDVAYSESEHTQVTYVVNGIHDHTVIGNSSEETAVVEDEDEGFSPGPDWYEPGDVDVAYSESEDTQVTYVVNGIYHDSVVGNSHEETTVFSSDDADNGFSPGPDWYESDDVDVAYSESEDTQVTYVVNGIHHDTVIGNSHQENVSDGVDEYEVIHQDDAYEDDDADIDVDSGDAFDDEGTSTYFDELSAGAGAGGAYVHFTEGGSFGLD